MESLQQPQPIKAVITILSRLSLQAISARFAVSYLVPKFFTLTTAVEWPT
jgi:hypothetical protein